MIAITLKYLINNSMNKFCYRVTEIIAKQLFQRWTHLNNKGEGQELLISLNIVKK